MSMPYMVLISELYLLLTSRRASFSASSLPRRVESSSSYSASAVPTLLLSESAFTLADISATLPCLSAISA